MKWKIDWLAIRIEFTPNWKDCQVQILKCGSTIKHSYWKQLWSLLLVLVCQCKQGIYKLCWGKALVFILKMNLVILLFLVWASKCKCKWKRGCAYLKWIIKVVSFDHISKHDKHREGEDSCHHLSQIQSHLFLLSSFCFDP